MLTGSGASRPSCVHVSLRLHASRDKGREQPVPVDMSALMRSLTYLLLR